MMFVPLQVSVPGLLPWHHNGKQMKMPRWPNGDTSSKPPEVEKYFHSWDEHRRLGNSISKGNTELISAHDEHVMAAQKVYVKAHAFMVDFAKKSYQDGMKGLRDNLKEAKDLNKRMAINLRKANITTSRDEVLEALCE